MTAYMIDLGFDWNAMPNGVDDEGNDLYFLNWGVVNMGNATTAPAPSTLAQFNAGDTLGFTIYDITSHSGGSSPAGTGPQLADPWLICEVGDTNTPAGTVPFSNYPALTSATNVVSNGLWLSSIFGQPASPAWTVSDQNSQPLLGQIQIPTGSAGPVTFLIKFGIEVVPPASSGLVSKTFRVDPEMIVTQGSGGG